HFAQRRFANLQRDPGSNVAVMPRRIAATMQIQAHCGGALQKLLAHSVKTGNQQRHRPFDARTAAALRPCKSESCIGSWNRTHTRSPRKRGQKIKKGHEAPNELERTRPSMALPPAAQILFSKIPLVYERRQDSN